MSKNAKKQLKAVQARPKKPRLPPRVALSPQQRMARIVTGLLGGPKGDPDEHHCLAAAHVLLLARQLRTPLEGEVVAEKHLRNSIYGLDFMDLAERNVIL